MNRALRLRVSVSLVLALTSIPVAARSGGLNLSWSDCGSAGQRMKTFACNTNSGSQTMIASFIAPVPMDHFVGMEGVIDACSMTAVLPAWWQMFVAGSCRPNAISSGFDFTSGPFSCADPWLGQAAGGMDYTIGYAWKFNSVRIRTVCAVPASAMQPIDDQTEYYAFKVTIKNDKTVGTDACAGCNEDLCIVLNSIKLVQQAGYGDYTLTSPVTAQYMNWQGPVYNCPFVVPVKPTTWGHVKSLYR